MASGLNFKELRETFNCLRIIKKKSWYSKGALAALINENSQLISIFGKSIETARRIWVKENCNKQISITSYFGILCSIFSSR